mmetsp:Transcript_45590/g.90998  ORF Transcript_45590/g.90998 Transcript_45590/m.90998 type:complete len:223 (+) Transcript_45590:321-989(+)
MSLTGIGSHLDGLMGRPCVLLENRRYRILYCIVHAGLSSAWPLRRHGVCSAWQAFCEAEERAQPRRRLGRRTPRGRCVLATIRHKTIELPCHWGSCNVTCRQSRRAHAAHHLRKQLAKVVRCWRLAIAPVGRLAPPRVRLISVGGNTHDETAEGPHVNALITRCVTELLGCEEEGRADAMGEGVVASDGTPGSAEVCNLWDMVCREEHVGWLEIAVDHRRLL